MTSTKVSAPTSSFGDGLDGLNGFEGINATECDEVPQSQSSAGQQEIAPTRRLEFGKIENEKVGLSSHLQYQIHSIVIGL